MGAASQVYLEGTNLQHMSRSSAS
ncbi:rCG55378 [Rattus norvegicus]|uniref:RCG55378 n=1 Tax=Rattus norvegicus TaxID=10116 RepID=A6JQW1_RAT|nr:rCG55378 [Rattus norvegicus]